MSEQNTVQRFLTTADLRAFNPDDGRTVMAILLRPDFCKIYFFDPKSTAVDDDSDVIQPAVGGCCLNNRGRWLICYDSTLLGTGGGGAGQRMPVEEIFVHSMMGALM